MPTEPDGANEDESLEEIALEEGDIDLPPMAPGYEPGNQVLRRARQRGGLPGLALAGALMGLQEVLEGPPKDPAPVVVQASSDPVDLDAEGVHLVVDGSSVVAPALAPYVSRPSDGRRRRRRRG